MLQNPGTASPSQPEANVKHEKFSRGANARHGTPLIYPSSMNRTTSFLSRPVLPFLRKNFASLRSDMTVQAALDHIRSQGLGERIIYFYVLDENHRLIGVVPTRRLLLEPLDKTIADIMVPRVVALSASATVEGALELFLMHRFFALPVLDEEGQLLGTVDVTQFTGDVFDSAETQERDAIFETLGFHIAQVRDASPLRAFRFRFPWLLATITSGTTSAVLTSLFALTLAQSLVLAFFLTLVLGLGESVGIQTMTVTIQALRHAEPSWKWFRRALRREMGTALLLGVACGTLVGLIVWFWQGEVLAAGVIGLGILTALASACFWGLTIPTLVHAWRLDPKIAAGPMTLAVADVFTLLFYFSLAALILG